MKFVYLRPVERPVSFVQLPLVTARIQGVSKLLLRVVPGVELSHVLLGACAQIDLEGEAENGDVAVDEEVEALLKRKSETFAVEKKATLISSPI